VKALPEGFETGALVGAVAKGWAFDAETIDFAPVGFGSYHWVARDAAGTRAFVTVDDLDRKAWLGDTRESVFDGLSRAFGSAVALRDAGLGFVLAPILTSEGEAVRRIGPRHSIAVFPFVEGRAGVSSTTPRRSERLFSRCLPGSIRQRPRSTRSRARSISTCPVGVISYRRSRRSARHGRVGRSPSPPGKPWRDALPRWRSC
jgi:hypothetical protein